MKVIVQPGGVSRGLQRHRKRDQRADQGKRGKERPHIEAGHMAGKQRRGNQIGGRAQQGNARTGNDQSKHPLCPAAHAAPKSVPSKGVSSFTQAFRTGRGSC
jgi:hypothetical protein